MHHERTASMIAGIRLASLRAHASTLSRAAFAADAFRSARSFASLARAVGPSVQALLIYSAIAARGFDGSYHHMSDHSICATFWTAAAIMFLAFLLGVYFARAHAGEYANGGAAEMV